ncbi:cholinesterase-like isoform X1 [Podarcis raffonei]|uniref:cholinesterase-like isoform X1 n=1 Tax=Podarcis raffonei TaxID=65483 RepID=UPI0023299C30|nr:cholinesterase-like isoform X1 [Podarcis raffonei]
MFRNPSLLSAVRLQISLQTPHQTAAMPGILSSLPYIYILLLFSPASGSAPGDDTVVVTKSGPIKGKHVSVGSGSVTAYLGIPYAEPPVGKLRFQKALPHQPWSQVLEATSYGNSCHQSIFSGIPDADVWAPNTPLSEDCLFLNIWVPHPRPSTPTPVLVFIHGGGFFSGTSSLDVYKGESLASTERVIVVNLNYRLGMLGFLSMPPAAPGNWGLLDQQLALRWVHENAAAFGGDPTRVTIFGHSAGAAAVGFHLLSPGSQPLFAQAVIQSGSPSAIWAWGSPEEAKQKSLTIAQLVGCADGDDSAVLSCLQAKDAAEFSPQEMLFFEKSKYLIDLPVIPTTDGDFLPDDPQKLLEPGHIKLKPVLIGFTSDEGNTFMPFSFPGIERHQFTHELLLKGIQMAIRNATQEDVQAVALEYSKEGQDPVQYYRALSQSFRDYFFSCPMDEFSKKLEEVGSPVYAYYFKHHTSGSFWPEWVGAPHDAELPYLFGTLEKALAANQTYTEAEADLSRRVMRYWAEFSRSGKPTGSAAGEVEWPLYNATQQNFFHLSTEPTQVVDRSPVQHCTFFNTLINKLKEDSAASHKEEDGKKESTTQ